MVLSFLPGQALCGGGRFERQAVCVSFAHCTSFEGTVSVPQICLAVLCSCTAVQPRVKSIVHRSARLSLCAVVQLWRHRVGIRGIALASVGRLLPRTCSDHVGPRKPGRLHDCMSVNFSFASCSKCLLHQKHDNATPLILLKGKLGLFAAAAA